MIAAAEEEESAPTGEAPPRSGDLLRALGVSAGFETVEGVDGLSREEADPASPQPFLPGNTPPPSTPSQTPDPPHETAPHHEMPAEVGNAPGFLLYLHSHHEGVVVEIASVRFSPLDDGLGVDEIAGDGIGSVMIERYPGGKPLVVRSAEGGRLVEMPLSLTTTGSIPFMALDLSAYQ